MADGMQHADLERQSAFTELLLESRSRLYGYMFALVHNASDADDLFQTTAAILWEKFEAFEQGTDFTSWALRTGNLVYRNFARSRQRSCLVLSDAAVANLTNAAAQAPDHGSTARMNAMNSCLSKLSNADRKLVEMCYADKLKIRDIAAESGRTDTSVYSAMARIRRALAVCVERRLVVECR